VKNCCTKVGEDALLDAIESEEDRHDRLRKRERGIATGLRRIGRGMKRAQNADDIDGTRFRNRERDVLGAVPNTSPSREEGEAKGLLATGRGLTKNQKGSAMNEEARERGTSGSGEGSLWRSPGPPNCEFHMTFGVGLKARDKPQIKETRARFEQGGGGGKKKGKGGATAPFFCANVHERYLGKKLNNTQL